MRATTFKCHWLAIMMLIEAVLFPAPIYSQVAEEQALAIAPSLQEIYAAINATEHNSKVTWESMPISDFSCRPGYFIGMRYGDPPLDENFLPSRSSSMSGPKFSRIAPAFDSRQTWPDRVGESANQGLCGLCWAIAWAGVMSDRFAIGYKGNYSVGDLSPLDLQTCAQTSPSCATSPSLPEISEHLIKVGVAKSSCFSFNGVLGASCQTECNDGGRPIRYDVPRCAAMASRILMKRALGIELQAYIMSASMPVIHLSVVGKSCKKFKETGPLLLP